jgi:hypothetical protein
MRLICNHQPNARVFFSGDNHRSLRYSASKYFERIVKMIKAVHFPSLAAE